MARDTKTTGGREERAASGRKKVHASRNVFVLLTPRKVNDTVESDSAVSNDTAELFAFANISVKSKPYAKILQHMNNRVRIVKITRVKILLTLSLKLRGLPSSKPWTFCNPKI